MKQVYFTPVLNAISVEMASTLAVSRPGNGQNEGTEEDDWNW